MRVLQISDSMKQRFGVTSFLMNYNEHIDLDRIIFDYLIIDAEDEIQEKIKNNRGRIYYMPKLSLKNAYDFKKSIESFFKNNHYDVVHSHFYQIDFVCSKIAYKYGTKHYISHSHSTKYSDYKLRSVRNYLMAFPIRFLSTDFCACSSKAGDSLFGKKILKIRNKEIKIIPNAIVYEKFYFNEEKRRELRVKYNLRNEIVFGNVGSLKPLKNHMFLLKTFKEINNQNSNTKLVLVGDGKLKEMLKAKAAELGVLKDVIFVGASKNPEYYYNMFDCYLFPSLHEGFGISLLEAQVNGLKCICSSRIPNEVIQSDLVLKLPIDEKSIRKWVHCSLNMNYDREFKRFTDKFNIKEQVQELMNYYERFN